MVKKVLLLVFLVIIINWGDDVLRSAGIRRQHQAADYIRRSDAGLAPLPLSGIVWAESSPSLVYTQSATSDGVAEASEEVATVVVAGAAAGAAAGLSGVAAPTTTDSVRLPPKVTLPF